MYCTHCHNILEPDDKFCNRCGYEVIKFEPHIDINDLHLENIKKILEDQSTIGKDQYAYLMGNMDKTGRFTVDCCRCFPENSADLSDDQYNNIYINSWNGIINEFKAKKYDFFAIIAARSTELGTGLSKKDEGIASTDTINFKKAYNATYLDGVVTDDEISFTFYDINNDKFYDVECRVNDEVIKSINPGKGAK
jgi:hypothetical protein